MKKVGITGYRGFIGSHLVRYLKDLGYELYLWDGDLTSPNGKDFYQSDLKNCDIIVHLAGKNKGNPQEILKTNAEGTLELIKFCASFKKPIPLIVAGADYKKEDAYKQSKDFIKLCCKTHSYFFLDTLILNIPKVVGEGCSPFYNSFITTLIYLASQDKLNDHLHLIKDVNEVIELIDVKDLCSIIERNIRNRFIGYNEYNFKFCNLYSYGDGFSISFKDLIDILNGNKSHRFSNYFLKLLDWYKNNDVKI